MNVNILKLHLKELKYNLQTLKEYAAQLVRCFDPRLGSLIILIFRFVRQEEAFLRTGSIDVVGVPKNIESIRGRVYKHRYVISKFTSQLSCGDRKVT